MCEFGGWVDSFTGDGVAAMFGGNVGAHESAERACSATLVLRDRLETYAQALREQTGVELMVRIGINSGQVVVGQVGGAPSGRVLTVGHAVGLAKRIEAIAGPGTVYVGASTASLIDDTFDLWKIGALEIRGAPEPVVLFELVVRAAHPPYGLEERNPRGTASVLACA